MTQQVCINEDHGQCRWYISFADCQRLGLFLLLIWLGRAREVGWSVCMAHSTGGSSLLVGACGWSGKECIPYFPYPFVPHNSRTSSLTLVLTWLTSRGCCPPICGLGIALPLSCSWPSVLGFHLNGEGLRGGQGFAHVPECWWVTIFLCVWIPAA